MAVRKLIAAAFALACPLGAAAFEGEQQDLRLIAESIHDASIAVDYDVKWKLSSLMGEPTRNLKIRWRLPRTAAIRLPNDPAYEGAPSNFLVRNLPPDIQDTIRLYDVNVPIGFTGHESGYDCSSLYAINVVAQGYVTFDAGAPAKPGDKWSYNVTGSPNWAEFMTDFQGRPLTKDGAKSVMSTPNLCGDVQDTQVTGKIALGEALRWIHKNFDKRSIAEMIAGSLRQLEILSDTLGLPIEGPYSEFGRLTFALNTAGTATEIADIRQQVEAALNKLRDGIPARYVPADKAQDYQAERDDISTRTEQILVELIPGESAYDAEAAAYQQWIQDRPIEVYKLVYDENDQLWVTDINDEKLVEAAGTELLAGRYLIKDRISCEESSVSLFDPISDEPVKMLNYSCSKEWNSIELRGRYPADASSELDLLGYELAITNSVRTYKDEGNRCKWYRDKYTDYKTVTTFDLDFEQMTTQSIVEQRVEGGSEFCLTSY